MASSGDQELRVPIGIPVETNAPQAADAIGALRDRIAQSKDAIKDASSAMRNLRGNSDEIKAAKDQLKATLDREKKALSDATLAMLKNGASVDKAASSTKALGKAQEQTSANAKALDKAISSAGGPVASLRDKIKSLGELAGDGSGLGMLTLAAAGLVAALVAAAAAAGAALVAFGRWIAKGADAARSLALMREAAAGTAEDAANLGAHIDGLAGKVATSKKELTEHALALRKAGLGGQVYVDALNAAAQANAALGQAAGSKIEEIIKRGRLMGRMGINPLELQGTGLQFKEIAQSLAESMRVSVADAQKALLEGRVKLGDGAAAIRAAMEKRLGSINLRKMLSFENLSATLEKSLSKLTAGVNLEPALRAVKKFFSIFDADETATGAALKRIVTVVGNGMVGAFERAIPLAEKFVRGMIVGGLKLYIGWLKVKNALKDTIGEGTLAKFDALGAALTVASFWLENGVRLFYGMVVAIGVAVAAFAALAVAVDTLFVKPFKTGYDFVANIEWSKLGSQIVDGIVGGLKGGAGKLVDTVKGLGTFVKKAFTGELEIHSPSKAFERYGKAIDDGAVGGIKKNAPAVSQAVADMAPSPPSASVAARAGTTTVNVSMTVNYSGSGGGAGEQLEPGLLEQIRQGLRKVLLEELAGAGIAVTA